MRRDRGLSLIELVVAMALFALVAVMGLQALGGMLRQRDALSTRADAAVALDRAAAQIAADLSAAVPMLFYPPEGAPPRSALSAERDGFALSVGGQPMLAADGAPLHRVEWRLRNGTLERRVWPTLIPARDTARHLPMNVARGVTGLRLRSNWPDYGWIDGVRPPSGPPAPADARDSDTSGGAPEVYSDTLPLAVEVVLSLDGFGDIPIRRALR